MSDKAIDFETAWDFMGNLIRDMRQGDAHVLKIEALPSSDIRANERVLQITVSRPLVSSARAMAARDLLFSKEFYELSNRFHGDHHFKCFEQFRESLLAFVEKRSS